MISTQIPKHFFSTIRFETEIIFTIIIVLLCFLIYYKTKESYSLTKYTGIKYFRLAFLFFGFSYAARLLFFIIRFSKMIFQLYIPKHFLFPLSLLLTSYLSTMGIFYLLFSTIWKKFNNNYLILFSNIIALFLSIAAFITRSHELLFYLQLIFLVGAISISIAAKKFSKIKLFYILILIFWLLNLGTLVPRINFPFKITITFQIISIIIFLIIYYKVSKWAK
jgi:hypothetical protein